MSVWKWFWKLYYLRKSLISPTESISWFNLISQEDINLDECNHFYARLFTFRVVPELNISCLIAIAALPRHATTTRTTIRALRAQRTSPFPDSNYWCMHLHLHSTHGSDVWSEPSVVCSALEWELIRWVESLWVATQRQCLAALGNYIVQV